VYRVVQEALTNCARHAAATGVRVAVTGSEGALDVVVTDDGVGVRPERRHHGIGLRGMEERARELGGTMTVQPAPGGGTTVAIRLPLADLEATKEASLAGSAG
jgi:signal transduction histidine kinase